MRSTSLLLVMMAGFTLTRAASSQTPAVVARPDPYRNFVGSWSGTIPINAEKMPSTVKLVITEEQDQTAMRWDYVFGVKGDRGFTRDTKWIVLQPASSKMVTFRKRSSALVYSTRGLRGFVQEGFGSFIAEVIFGKNAVFDKVTFNVQPNSLSSLWETSRDGKNYAAYSKFVFKRDISSNNVKEAISNKE